jgi:hypothetical protein
MTEDVAPIADRLAGQLDVPVDRLEEPAVIALGFGLRGRQLFRSILKARPADATAAEVVVRALIELTILTRWIEDDPLARIELWIAEDSRLRLLIAERIGEMRGRRGQPRPPAFEPARAAEHRAVVAKARKAAKDGGGTGKGSLLPRIEDMAKEIPDLWELYEIAYRGSSTSTHTAAMSMGKNTFEQRDDGVYLVPNAAWGHEATTAMAAMAFLVLIETVSRQVGLGLEREACEARMNAFSQSEDETEGQGGPFRLPGYALLPRREETGSREPVS